MTTAEQRGWGSPDAPNYQRDHIVRVTAGGIALLVRKEVAPLIAGFCNDVVARGYKLNVTADDWGYANRDIRGRPGVKSNHAWGLAIDLNSSTNPMTEDGHVHTDMPGWMPQLAADRYHLFWGGHYSGQRKDAMHYEFLGTPAEAARAVAELAAHPTEDHMPAVKVWQAPPGAELSMTLGKDKDSLPAVKFTIVDGETAAAILAVPGVIRENQPPDVYAKVKTAGTIRK